LRIFIETFPALEGEDNDDRKTQMVSLIRDTAASLRASGLDPVIFSEAPQAPMVILEAECVLRLRERSKEDERLEDLRNAWMKGLLPQWDESADLDELRVEAERRLHDPMRKKVEASRQGLRSDRLDRAADTVVDVWRERIDSALTVANAEPSLT
jgi:hypothetical protein